MGVEKIGLPVNTEVLSEMLPSYTLYVVNKYSVQSYKVFAYACTETVSDDSTRHMHKFKAIIMYLRWI